MVLPQPRGASQDKFTTFQKCAERMQIKSILVRKMNPNKLRARICYCWVSFGDLKVEGETTNLSPSVEEKGQDKI